MNRRRSGKTCSGTRALVGVMLLMMLGVIALIFGSGAATLPLASSSASSLRPFASTPTPLPNPATPQSKQQVLATYGRLPLIFEPNQGQTDPKVQFLARGTGYGLYLTADEAVLALQGNSRHSADRNSAVRMKLVGANSTTKPAGDGQLPGISNYLIGNDPSKWHRDVPQFARVRYRDVYPGIDLVYYGNKGRLEYDFEIAPGGNPSRVAFKLTNLANQGPHNLKIAADGDLVLNLGGGDVRLQAPRIYQKFGAEERMVDGRFELRGRNQDEVGFQLGAYDRSRALVIDPVLAYSTYLGGSGVESCSAITGLPFTPGCPAIAVDAASNAYVAGSTTSTNFPQTAGEFQPELGTGATANVFIAKFNVSGVLLFATYLGGNGTDYAAGVAADTGFDIIVAGTASSGNFPTTNGPNNTAFQTTPVSGGKHVFVSKLDPTGRILLYSTYLSGHGIDIASGLAVDQAGSNAYVTGTTTSTDSETGFPSTLGSYQTTSKATNQFFFTKVDPNASGSASILYSTYFGGSSPSTGTVIGGGIAVDTNSNAYITGGTNFIDVPMLDAYQATNKGGLDVIVAKFNPAGVTGTQLLYSTYLGGSGDDIGYGIAVDTSPNAYITGSTTSTDFNNSDVGTTALQPSNGGGTDAFVAKLGVLCTGTSCTTPLPLIYFSYLGGAGTDIGTAIGVDNNAAARITGWTNSPNFPIVGNPLQSTYGGGSSDAFYASVDTLATCSPITTPTCVPTSTSSYFGGSGADLGTGLALDTQGSSYLAGETTSTSGFPLKNSAQGALSGPSDAYAARLSPVLNLTMPAPAATPLVVGVGSQVSFAYTITNSGEFTNGVTFVDNLPATGATFVSATASPGTCGAAVNLTVLCNVGTLNAAATATITVVLTPVAPTIPGGTVSLGNSGSAFVGQSQLATSSASVTVNDFNIKVVPATVTVPAGVPAIFTALVTPSSDSGFPESVSISCGSGLPTGTTCLPGNNNPIPNLNTGAQSSQLIVNSTARVTTTTELRHGRGPAVPLYATLLPVSGLALLGAGLGSKGSRRRRLLIGLFLFTLFALIMFLPACSSSTTTTTTTGTPAGTYTVTINAVSGNATRSTVVALVIQ